MKKGQAAIERPAVSARALKGQAAIARTPSSARTWRGQAAIERTSSAARSLRGQAAMEYLMTYGWALLILGIIVTLIYASGAFSPSYLISEECNLGPKLPCQFQLYSKPEVTNLALRIENGFGYALHIQDISIEMDSQGPMNIQPLAQGTLASGKSGEMGASVGEELGKGSVQVMRVTLRYYSCAPEVNPACAQPADPGAIHTISGRIVGKVQ